MAEESPAGPLMSSGPPACAPAAPFASDALLPVPVLTREQIDAAAQKIRDGLSCIVNLCPLDKLIECDAAFFDIADGLNVLIGKEKPPK